MTTPKHVSSTIKLTAYAPYRLCPYTLKIWGKGQDGEDYHIADTRGWGALTGGGAQKLDEATAIEVQKATGQFIVDALNAHAAAIQPDPQPVEGCSSCGQETHPQEAACIHCGVTKSWALEPPAPTRCRTCGNPELQMMHDGGFRCRRCATIHQEPTIHPDPQPVASEPVAQMTGQTSAADLIQSRFPTHHDMPWIYTYAPTITGNGTATPSSAPASVAEAARKRIETLEAALLAAIEDLDAWVSHRDDLISSGYDVDHTAAVADRARAALHQTERDG